MTDQLRIDQLIVRQRNEVVDVADPLTELEIELRGFASRAYPVVELKVSFFRDGFHLGTCHDTPEETPMREGAFVSRITIPGDVFRSGRYSIGIGASASIGVWMWGQDVAVLDFSEDRGGRSAARSEGVVAIPHRSERVQSEGEAGNAG